MTPTGSIARWPVQMWMILVVFGTASAAPEIEPWADASLPVKQGLAAWFDVSLLGKASAAKGDSTPENGQAVTTWFDGSGWKRDLKSEGSAAPLFKNDLGAGATLRFDGLNDRLEVGNLGLEWSETTLFIVAAPRSNAGGFLAFLAFNQSGLNDYTSGLTIDMSAGGSRRFETLNPEGAGFGGARDLMESAFNFGTFHVIAVTSSAGTAGIRLFIDGKTEGTRERASGVIRADHLLVGARRYSHTAEPPFPRGFLDGDIAEVLMYDRVLDDTERSRVESYLLKKHAALRSLAGISNASGSMEWVPVENPPPIQMLVPGFTAREIPVELNNLNCVSYREDGKLVALGYNGNLYLLSDRDGDGLEETVETFWDRGGMRSPIGMALTPPNYGRGAGVFVPSKGKLSLIVDTNSDDRADEEIVVAEGWQELSHNVDALGVAMDRDGSIYFSLGTEAFYNAYLIDPATGRAGYHLGNEHGTVQRVSADFSKRETVCTGVRFPVSMAFNAAGDLFCTDQEGATWLANGNPFDELLHIEPGRHYGFPPRHARHLPDPIDEPSVYDYEPQHQSTCGLVFNEPVNGGSIFGPDGWRSDALVAGYSRGKLYRTQLMKTSAGYVAQNQLLACLNQLTVDPAISPSGDLVVAVHSGKPDWGTGPNGPGKLYKVSYTDRTLPQPVLVHSLSPTRTRIAFDRPLDPEQLKNRKSSVIRGRYTTAGERFESFQPGYQVINDQLNTPRFNVPVLATHLSADRRDLVLTTESRREAMRYALTLPGLGRPGTNVSPGILAQHPAIDLAHTLNGIEAEWRSDSGDSAWEGWLPHPDLAVARQFTRGSAEHDRLWTHLTGAGTLTMRGQIDLWLILRPATQPGSILDYEWPPETVFLTLHSKGRLILNLGDKRLTGEGRLTVSLPAGRDWIPVELKMTTTGAEENRLELSWHTNEDPRERALPLRRLFVPWAISEPEPEQGRERNLPELAGGDWLRGRQLFLGDRLACYKCHRMQGVGGTIGPELSNLIHRDYDSVLQDIREPSAAINPDHLAYNVELKDGEMLSGVIQGDNAERLSIGTAAGEVITVPKGDVAAVRASALSIMPEGLDKGMSEGELKDLLTYLLTSPLTPAPLTANVEPPLARPHSELEAVLGKRQGETAAPAGAAPLHVVLAAGPKDHGPGEHDYPLWQERWAKLLPLAEGVTTSTTMEWPSAELFKSADVIVFYSHNPGWSAERAPDLDAFLKRGGGLIYIHYAVDGLNHVTEFSERIGLAWRGGQSKFRHGPLELRFEAHPITEGIQRLQLVDESYWNLAGRPESVTLLATGIEEGAAQPLMWTKETGNGRVFVSIPGHYTWTFDDPMFRLLIFRAITWTARQPIDRLAPLSTIGAR